MLFPLLAFVIGIAGFGLFSAPVTELFTAVAQGAF